MTTAKTDQMKGRVKEAAGSLIGNDDLESEGKDDRRAGDAKETVDQATGAVKKAADWVGTKATEAIDRAKGTVHRP